MKDDRLIKVLWVEDDTRYAKGFIGLYADEFDICHVDNWQDAQALLEKDFNAFEAIILDARCRTDLGSVDNSRRFMVKAFASLSALMQKYSKIIPWYVLSGGDKDEIDDLIPDDRNKWDGDWEDVYYRKSQDEDVLVARIKAYCQSHTPLMLQIKDVLFKETFDAIASLSISSLEEHMLYMLRPLADPNIRYDVQGACGKARNMIEAIFKDMYSHGLLPEVVKRKNGSIVMEWCSIVLAGEPAEIAKQKDLKQAYESKGLDCPLFGRMPKIMTKNLQTLYKTCCNVAHDASRQQSQNRTYRYDDYQAAVGHTPYLLRSFALQLCDLILWYDRWLKSR